MAYPEIQNDISEREVELEKLREAYVSINDAMTNWEPGGDWDALRKKGGYFNKVLDEYKRKFDPIGFCIIDGILYER